MVKEENPFGVSITKRYVSSGGERELFREHKIGKTGSIVLVDYMGGDEMVERVATAGHGRDIFPEKLSQEDFLRYTADWGITQPFKSIQAKFRIEAPISVGLDFIYDPNSSVNEYSLRYSNAPEGSFLPSEESVAKILGRSQEEARKIVDLLKQTRNQSYGDYNALIELDMARELARSLLGTDQDTKFIWKIDLPSFVNLDHRLRARDDKFALSKFYSDTILEVFENIAYNSSKALYLSQGFKKTPTSEAPLLRSKSLTLPTDEEVIDSPLSPPSWEPQETRRVTVQGIEKLLFAPETVLDHGQFQVVDYMGDDNSLAEAARTSYGEGTKTLTDNKNLVRSLIRDRHTSPIEMAELAFESKAPVFSDIRQAGRHRTLDFHCFMGYVPKGSQVYFPNDEEFKYQDRTNRQGRGKHMEEHDLDAAKRIFEEGFERQRELIKLLRENGTPESLVRQAKGVGHYTKVWRTGDVKNLIHYLSLRDHSHAQKEIRVYAEKVREALKAFVPVAYEASRDYLLDGMSLSIKEIEVLRRMMNEAGVANILDLSDPNEFRGGGFVVVDKDSGEKRLTREGTGFQTKLKRLLEDQS